MAIKNKAEKLRFGLVGTANTVIDFGILFILTSLGMPSVISNIFSTSAAFTFSFFVNKTFTFKSKGTTKKQFLLFIVITLFGLWVIQGVIIWAVSNILGATGFEKNLALLIAKLLATIVTLIWNYSLYSRLVFKKETD